MWVLWWESVSYTHLLGTYEITETKQAEGYILPEKSVEIELEYEGQDVPCLLYTSRCV